MAQLVLIEAPYYVVDKSIKRNPKFPLSIPPSKLMYELSVALIREKRDDKIWVTFQTCRNRTWSFGPTLPGNDAVLFLSDRKVCPTSIGIEFGRNEFLGLDKADQVFADVKILNDLRHDYLPVYKLIEPLECVICLDQIANTYCLCKPAHSVCCTHCVKKIKSCPVCRQPIVGFFEVSNDLLQTA